MQFSTTFNLIRIGEDGEENEFELDVVYDAWEDEIELTQVSYMDQPFETTDKEDKEIIEYLWDNLNETYLDAKADEADYRYDMRMDR